MSESLLLSRRDLAFQLYDWLDAQSLVRAPRYAEHSRETFDAVIDACERMATDLFAPHYQAADRDEPRFDGTQVHVHPAIAPALRAFAQSGLAAASQDTGRGGMQLPTLIEKAAMTYFYAANVSTIAYALLTMANARLLLAHGTPAQIEAFAQPQLDGRWFGTMCLSEPQAGSSLSDIATRAEFDADTALGAQYRLHGRKMWISGGDHDLAGNIVHLVLAKIPDADGRLVPGTKGISLFAVPKFLPDADGAPGMRNDVVVAGINHKMGYRGTVNCLLNFGEGVHRPHGRAGAIGYLVGAPGVGLACMFHMMNEARIGVGLGAVALGYTGYLHALDYARHRPQGRPVGAAGKDAAQPQVPLIDHADVRRMLLAQKAYVEGGLGLNLYCAKLVDEARVADDADTRRTATQLLDILTPIAKSWPSQWCLAANDLAIQVHGGYGYTRDYKVEQFWRDNRLNAIHEGTHGIQALDLLGRKVTMEGGAAFAALSSRIDAAVSRARSHAALADHAGALGARLARLQDLTRRLWAAGDTARTLADASVYLEAFGHVVVAWIWLEQATVAQGRRGELFDGKRAAADFFFTRELPRVDAMFDLLSAFESSPLRMRDAWF
ncbi:acyl-CoA dehydrogenase [Chiayiivirga flava]|uniref:Alkylation response protein AidB-like acyl-CoA dehydrogenase n=1 Tax=Chiayiivirga flava TaxID=659595 RepID=A0A7W8FZY7_9GAMM|nr:acyl-CoA dehydrogenase [Chiayiivirga flava]MBB5207699.1 alkylation response protein AidB-like acyl-CoA dehydrogenase [Chiayiivirga flava]